MKRIGNIWHNVVDVENGVQSVIDGTRYKRYQLEVQKFLFTDDEVKNNPSLWHMVDKEKARKYSAKLCKSLDDGTWKHKEPKHRRRFCRNRASSKGKWRDLYVPSLDDHIVGHMVMSASMDAFTKGMHQNCCGSVPGRGIKHVNKSVKKWFIHDKECRYFVKLDIRHFFDNIDSEILFSVLRSKIKDERVLDVFRQIINSAPTPCPVGYYTSPWLANLYLEELDWYAEQSLFKERRGKRIKYVRHYLRYVDDILLVGTSKSDLEKAVRAIQKWLFENRRLKVKPEWEIKAIGKHVIEDGQRKMKNGTYWCDIGGYKFCKDSTILRDGIYLSSKRLAKKMHKQKYYTYHQSASINSRIGWARHCDSKNFIRKDIEPYVNISTARRIVSDVDKIRKRLPGATAKH